MGCCVVAELRRHNRTVQIRVRRSTAGVRRAGVNKAAQRLVQPLRCPCQIAILPQRNDTVENNAADAARMEPQRLEGDGRSVRDRKQVDLRRAERSPQVLEAYRVPTLSSCTRSTQHAPRVARSTLRPTSTAATPPQASVVRSRLAQFASLDLRAVQRRGGTARPLVEQDEIPISNTGEPATRTHLSHCPPDLRRGR